ncbi:MAG: NAD(P)/FAD-dependent oxidoreductase [Clostridia bacterium]|nr:NAD(P)/FAD-dependent oxidoreductase [Clostridia bacterium]
MKKIAVIGGGPAGMLAAYYAAMYGASVTLIEKNEILGKKLNITGKGRCNLTNACDTQEFLANVPTNPRFLYKALNNLSTDDTMALFNDLGVPLKVERGRRVFPVSDKATDISKALRDALQSVGVKVIKGKVLRVLTEDKKVNGIELLLDGLKRGAHFDGVILATGGLSYPTTGSTGDGFRFAESLGHTVVTPRPSLVPLVVKESYCKDIMGLSLKNVTASFFTENGKLLVSEFGEMLFTHFGVSGPIILSASAHLGNTDKAIPLKIDLKPALDEAALDKRLLNDFGIFKNKDFCNSLDELLPQKLIPTVITLSGIDPRKKVNEITKAERASLVSILKNFPLTVIGRRPIEEAIVTSGGIKVSEINPSTMESKLIKGLYFAGEMIDVDAYTGGYNLQIAFSTGALAGQSAASEE